MQVRTGLRAVLALPRPVLHRCIQGAQAIGKGSMHDEPRVPDARRGTLRLRGGGVCFGFALGLRGQEATGGRRDLLRGESQDFSSPFLSFFSLLVSPPQARFCASAGTYATAAA